MPKEPVLFVPKIGTVASVLGNAGVDVPRRTPPKLRDKTIPELGTDDK
jgi:hypothetical protein